MEKCLKQRRTHLIGDHGIPNAFPKTIDGAERRLWAKCLRCCKKTEPKQLLMTMCFTLQTTQHTMLSLSIHSIICLHIIPQKVSHLFWLSENERVVLVSFNLFPHFCVWATNGETHFWKWSRIEQKRCRHRIFSHLSWWMKGLLWQNHCWWLWEQWKDQPMLCCRVLFGLCWVWIKCYIMIKWLFL